MERVLVTGASGLVGRYLIRLLLKKGYYVRAISRTEPAICLDNQSSDYYEWLHVDFGNESIEFDKLIDNIDHIIHLAAQVHILNDNSKETIETYKKINIEATEKLVQASVNKSAKRFIFLSTIKVNGESSHIIDNKEIKKITCADQPVPVDAYSLSKYEAEQKIQDICKNSHMEFTIIRPPLVYGPGVKANFLRLLKVVYQQLPLPFGAIDNLRSFIYVENLVDILFNCMSNQNAANKIYLIKDIDISTPELIKTISKSFKKKALMFSLPVKFLKLMGNITGKQASVDRLTESLVIDDSEIRKDLEWSPPYTMEYGMKETAEWYLSQL